MSFFFKKVKNLILKRKSSHFIKPKFCGFSTHSILLNDKALNKLIQSTMSKNIDTIDVYRSLLENYGAVNSSIQISKKFSFFSKVGKLGEKFSMRPIKILENSPMSVLLENKQNRKTNRFAIHFHSIGFVAGSPLDVYKPISHLFEDLNCDKILCVGLNSIEHAKLSDIFETALNAYNYVVRKFEADKSKLIISGSASGCLLTTKILNYLNSKQEKTGEKHPQLHYRMAPIFIRKPSKFYCGAIISL
ncbi:hypothetical protein MHBO_002232 [Bonamia ostreae]|uniref:Uncharacterized protein n=1 Tax=Bonamia ostreae TaxID=126728 RepID=A0ABV2ALP1_9EUKA